MEVQNINRNKAMRNAILAQCAGLLSLKMFNNGFLLNYFSRIGMSASHIMYLLGVPALCMSLMTIPAAFISDQTGKKKLGGPGLLLTAVSYVVLFLSTLFTDINVIPYVFAGVILYGLGHTIYLSSWFVLLRPIVPSDQRGRFFGRLRLSFHLVSLVATWIIFYFLDRFQSIETYSIILFSISLLLILRLVLYLRIPEVEKSKPNHMSLKKSLMKVIKTPGCLPFGAYVFLLRLFIGASPWIFGLLEKEVLGFSESQIVLMGNFLFIGAIVGFFTGGRIVDRLGTKYVFLICHFAFALILFLFLLRDLLFFKTIMVVSFLTFAFGLVNAASSISITTEMMSLIPRENKSLSTAFNSSLLGAGTTLSAFMGGKALDLKILSTNWTLFGETMSQYDSLLLIYCIMVVLMLITLGLIPSVIQTRKQDAGVGLQQ